MMQRGWMICRYVILFILCSYLDNARAVEHVYGLGAANNITIGTYQIGIGGSKRYDSYYQWKVKHRDMAGHMVYGVSNQQTQQEGRRYYPGREEMRTRGTISPAGCLFGQTEMGTSRLFKALRGRQRYNFDI